MKIFSMDVERDVNSAIRFAKLLTKHKTRGEFFIVGAFVEELPKKCKKYFGPHIVGGHGFFHEDFSKMLFERQAETIIKTKNSFRAAGMEMDGWRFPGLNYGSDSLRILARMKIFDSSIRRRALQKWGKTIFLRNWMRNLKYRSFTIPAPFPSSLDERPWDFIDLGNPNILSCDGRLILHCFNYPKIEKEMERYIKSISKK